MPPLLIVVISLLAQPSLQSDGSVVILERKYVGNVPAYFNKNFEDYKAGFESRGELWLGLEKLHEVTSQGSYSLHITLKDWDYKTYVAVYDQFEVGPGHGYMLTVAGFNRALSTLGDSMTDIGDGMNGVKFSTKDLDQDNRDDLHCAIRNTGGWWYNLCGSAHLTGLHAENRTRIDAWRQIYYRHGGDRVGELNSFDSWKEARMTLVANVPQLYPINAFLSKNGYQNNRLAAKCIDGVKTDSGNMCHTDCDTNAPWLALEFLEPVKVTNVDIYNRGDTAEAAARLKNVEVRLTDELPTSDDQMYTEGQLLGTFQGPGTLGHVIRVESSAKTGRYVLIQMNHRTCLNLQEVEVFGSVSNSNSTDGAKDFQDGVTAEPESSPVGTTEGKVTSVENDTFLYVVIALAAFSAILLLLLIGVIILMYKMWSTAKNAIKKDINPLYGVEYEEGVEVKHPSAEAKGRNVDPRSNSVDQPYDYMGS